VIPCTAADDPVHAITLIPVFHLHRSAFEDDAAIAPVVDRVCLPLLEALIAAPGVKAGLRFSGRLYEFFDEKRPEANLLIKRLLERDQVELLGGPWAEAALHLVAERDAVAQVRQTIDRLFATFGRRPVGAVLAGGAWDPTLPRVLARSGVQYTFLDASLLAGGAPSVDRLEGWYVAEREGSAVGVFPWDQRLRALVPWALPRFLASELQLRASMGVRCLTVPINVVDLGLAPGSAEWCWAQPRGWVASFLRMLAAHGSWLKLSLPSAQVERTRPTGRVYPVAGLPVAQAALVLPPAAGRVFERIQRTLQLRDDPVLSEAAPWIQPPPLDAALARSDEGNRLHKRALRVSVAIERLRRKVRQSPGDAELVRRTSELGQRLLQTQDYSVWMAGPDGMLVRPEFRHRAWLAMIALESEALAAIGDPPGVHHELVDYDCDGLAEVMVRGPQLGGVVRLGHGGALAELTRAGLGNLLNTLSRQEEAWWSILHGQANLPSLLRLDPHASNEQVVVVDENEAEVDDEDEVDEMSPPSGVGRGLQGAPPPERPPTPLLERGLERHLHVDSYVRGAFIDRFLGPQTTLESLARGQPPELGDFIGATYQLVGVEAAKTGELHVSLAREGTIADGEARRLVRIAKRYSFSAQRPAIDVSYELANRYHDPIRARFAVELTLNVDGRRGPERYLRVQGHDRWFLDRGGQAEGVQQLDLVMEDLGVQVSLRSNRPALVLHYPVLTPLHRVEGYSAAYQGQCVLFAWDVELWGQEKQRIDLTLAVSGPARAPAPTPPDPGEKRGAPRDPRR
jgi:4-alpha-glucanotransferase